MRAPTADEIRAFVRRDHALVAESKARYWAERKQRMGPAEAIAAADEQRRQVRAARPDWPGPEERAADLASHQRVAELLGRVR